MERGPQLGDSSALHHELPFQVPYAGTLSERLLFSIKGGVEARLAKRDRETARHGASNDAGFPDIMCVRAHMRQVPEGVLPHHPVLNSARLTCLAVVQQEVVFAPRAQSPILLRQNARSAGNCIPERGRTRA